MIRDLRGGKAKIFRRRSEESTDDKTTDTRCFPCASAQGASPVTSTTKKVSDILSLTFFVFKSDTGLEGRQGENISPQVGGIYRRQNNGYPLFSVRVRSRRKSRHLNHKKSKRYLVAYFFCIPTIFLLYFILPVKSASLLTV